MNSHCPSPSLRSPRDQERFAHSSGSRFSLVHLGAARLFNCALIFFGIANASFSQDYQVGDLVVVVKTVRVVYDDGTQESIWPATHLMVRDVDDGRIFVRWTKRTWLPVSAIIPAEEYDVAYVQEWVRKTPCRANTINLGATYYAQGEFEKARAQYETALNDEPGSTWSLNAMGWFLASCPEEEMRDGDRAVEICRKACERSEWKESMFIASLASAYAELGDFEKATEMIKRAILMDWKFRGLRGEMLRAYQEGRPYYHPAAFVPS